MFQGGKFTTETSPSPSYRQPSPCPRQIQNNSHNNRLANRPRSQQTLTGVRKINNNLAVGNNKPNDLHQHHSSVDNDHQVTNTFPTFPQTTVYRIFYFKESRKLTYTADNSDITITVVVQTCSHGDSPTT